MKNKITQKTEEELISEEKSLTWKYFWQQKLYELGIFPTFGLGVYFIPYWVGLLSNFIFNKTSETRLEIWLTGFCWLFLLIGFIYANYSLAQYRARKKLNKYSWFDLNFWEEFGF